MVLFAATVARGETVVWADGFENNAAKRWTANSVWHIGSPSAGPGLNSSGFRTHSATNCASTQGYPYGQDARLICTNYNGANCLIVPSATLSPRLRFWHWFSLQTSLGFVEISTNFGTNWNQISPTYSYTIVPNGSGVWSRPWIDLSQFAGQSVQFAFRFYGASPGNGLGWYVDDVAVVTSANPPVQSFPESFEFDPKTSDWTTDYGTWEIGKPTSGPNAAHTGTNCAATVLAGNYANFANARLTSPPFVVPATNAILRYQQWYNFANNALGFVEINNGAVITTSITNTTVTTNATPISLNTNVYQIFGSLNTNYVAPFYWNPTIDGWTNATTVLANAIDIATGVFNFEGGSAPLAQVGGTNVMNVVDYQVTSELPMPQSPTPTNFLDLQGITWNSQSDSFDNPTGYFGTNYTYTYTTNTTVTTSSANWNQISVTWQNGSTLNSWIPVALDLSAFAGQTVQLGFHFGSGSGTPAAGWYIDDISLVAPPSLTVPTNQIIAYGQTATNQLSATNSVDTGSLFMFGLAAASTNVVVATNGVVTWTNKVAPPGTYAVFVQVTDNNSPPYSVTNNFSYTVLPPLSSQLVLSNAAAITHGGGFKLSVTTPLTNSTWVVLASTNLAGGTANWVPIYTNHTGPGGALSFTDLLSTNFLQRYYRAVFP
jgi:hypothetical protein